MKTIEGAAHYPYTAPEKNKAGAFYVSDELLRDSARLGDMLSRAFGYEEVSATNSLYGYMWGKLPDGQRQKLE